MNWKIRWSTIAALLTLVAAVVFVGAVASDADAQGVTSEQLAAQGWTCFVPPPPFNDRISCVNPGHGRPVPDNPDPPPSYSFIMFDLASGEKLSTVHLIRADLYAGQPCRGGEPYRFLARIGYYECVHA